MFVLSTSLLLISTTSLCIVCTLGQGNSGDYAKTRPNCLSILTNECKHQTADKNFVSNRAKKYTSDYPDLTDVAVNLPKKCTLMADPKAKDTNFCTIIKTDKGIDCLCKGFFEDFEKSDLVKTKKDAEIFKKVANSLGKS